jgi:hypothetical protein
VWSTKIKLIDWVWLVFIATLSFFISGLPFYPFLNSDIAVHVLMTESFSFRYDLYFWGQDRLGSLVPMVANIVYRISGISPFWLTALTKWFFLCVGCFSFWYFIPNRFQRWVWTCLWFFPAYEMMYHLLPGHPYAEQMAMFGLSLVFFKRWIQSSSSVWDLPLFLLFSILSFWLSDFSLVFYAALFIGFFFSIINQVKLLSSKPWTSQMFWTFSVLISGIFFILYAKLSAARDETYTLSMFGSEDQILHSISMLWFYTRNVLLFESVSIWNSIYFYATLTSILFLAVSRKKLRFQASSKVFFLISIIGFILIVSLRWLAINFVMLKYFIPVFFSLWLGILSIDFADIYKRLRLLLTVVITLIVLGCSGSIIYQYNHPSERDIYISDLQSPFFKTQKSIIGDYWYSYIFAIANPELIATTPHDLSSVRNWKQVDRVIESDTIYICLNNWMDEAPQNLIQFDTELSLINTIEEGQFKFARYRKIGNN